MRCRTIIFGITALICVTFTLSILGHSASGQSAPGPQTSPSTNAAPTSPNTDLSQKAPTRETKESKEVERSNEIRGAKETKDAKEIKESKEIRESSQVKDQPPFLVGLANAIAWPAALLILSAFKADDFICSGEGSVWDCKATFEKDKHRWRRN